MVNRPTDLADRLSIRREPYDGFTRETFTLPVEAARLKARKILSQFPQGGYGRLLNAGGNSRMDRLNS